MSAQSHRNSQLSQGGDVPVWGIADGLSNIPIDCDAESLVSSIGYRRLEPIPDTLNSKPPIFENMPDLASRGSIVYQTCDPTGFPQVWCAFASHGLRVPKERDRYQRYIDKVLVYWMTHPFGYCDLFSSPSVEHIPIGFAEFHSYGSGF